MSGYAALITGSSRGIGKGIALALAREGFAVAVKPVSGRGNRRNGGGDPPWASRPHLVGDVGAIDGHAACWTRPKAWAADDAGQQCRRFGAEPW